MKTSFSQPFQTSGAGLRSMTRFLAVPALFALVTVTAQAQITIAPLSTFGVNGWLAPAAAGVGVYLDTTANQRGLAFGNGHLYLVSRSNGNNVRMLDPITGADLGGLNVSGITGGTFQVNTIGVGGDGAIYVNNLTTQSTTSPLKVYSWATEGSAPAVVYSGDGGLAGSRVGDSLAVFGSGTSTKLAAGYATTPAVAGNNSYAIINPSTGTATAIGFTGTPPAAGDFRLGLTFANASQVFGTQGSSLYRNTTFSGATGSLLGSPAIPDPAGATADRLLSYNVVGPTALLAVQSIGDSHVSLYDVTDPNNPIYLASGNNTTGALTANSNGTGQLAWGTPVYNSNNGTWTDTLYAMGTAQGIQAFVVTVPEPGTFALLALGGLAAVAWRKKLRQ